MLFKEKGYDVFLAQQIQRGLNDIEQGRIVSLAELDEQVSKLLERKAIELNEAEQGLIYG